jgi:hypothetical protein
MANDGAYDSDGEEDSEGVEDWTEDSDGANDTEGAGDAVGLEDLEEGDLLAFAPASVNSISASLKYLDLGCRFLFRLFLRRLCNSSLLIVAIFHVNIESMLLQYMSMKADRKT